MVFLVSDVAAATVSTAPAAASDGGFSLVMVGAIFVLFYFMLIRPQNKRAKEHRQLVSQLQKGDEIVTSGGMFGKVTGIDEQILKVVIADGVEISLQRSSVTSVLPKGTCKFN